MNAHFEAFLDRHYFDQEKLAITTILKDFNWYQLVEIRVNHIIESESPDYATIVPTMIQSINDRLRVLDNLKEKKDLEEILAELFRNMIAYLCQQKLGFHKQLPQMVECIKSTYAMNGDDFSELALLINFDGFTENIKQATLGPLPQQRKTSHLKWNHSEISADDLCQYLRDYSLITQESKFTDLFKKTERNPLFIPIKQRKRFALIMHKLFDHGFMVSVGSKSKYQFIEENVKSAETLKRFSEGYIRRTVNNTNSNGIGYEKHQRFLNDFMHDAGLKSRQ